MSPAELSGIVLAGTHNWSGSIFERLAPRPLVPVAQAPLISYPLRWLREGGIRHATVCLNGPTRAIEASLGEGGELDMQLSYYHDGTPRGPAGCVRDAGVRTSSRRLVVVVGAAIPTVDFADLIASHCESGAAMTAVVYRAVSDAAPTPGGVYVFERRVLDYVLETGFQDIKENLIPKLRRAGQQVAAYESGGYCPHVLNAQTYLAVNHWMLRQLADNDFRNALVHPRARVDRGARLVGPVQLGSGAHVAAGATVVGPTSIGIDCEVGPNALVARSVVWNRCTVGEDSVVHGCVLGHDAAVATGARLFYAVQPARERAQASPLRLALRRTARRPAPASAAGPVLGNRIPGSFLARASNGD
jgi:mannose-1-phosphate guanylyltransferase